MAWVRLRGSGRRPARATPCSSHLQAGPGNDAHAGKTSLPGAHLALQLCRTDHPAYGGGHRAVAAKSPPASRPPRPLDLVDAPKFPRAHGCLSVPVTQVCCATVLASKGADVGRTPLWGDGSQNSGHVVPCPVLPSSQMNCRYDGRSQRRHRGPRVGSYLVLGWWSPHQPITSYLLAA